MLAANNWLFLFPVSSGISAATPPTGTHLNTLVLLAHASVDYLLSCVSIFDLILNLNYPESATAFLSSVRDSAIAAAVNPSTKNNPQFCSNLTILNTLATPSAPTVAPMMPQQVLPIRYSARKRLLQIRLRLLPPIFVLPPLPGPSPKPRKPLPLFGRHGSTNHADISHARLPC